MELLPLGLCHSCSHQWYCSTPGTEVPWWHSGPSGSGHPMPTLQPSVGTSGRATGSSQELQSHLLSAQLGQGWVAFPFSRGQRSLAAWPAPRAVGWREKSLPHPAVPTPEPWFSDFHSFLCVRGEGQGRVCRRGLGGREGAGEALVTPRCCRAPAASSPAQWDPLGLFLNGGT